MAAGRYTVTRPPRASLVTLIVALVMLLAHIFGLSEHLVGIDLAPTVDRVLEGAVAVAAWFGWAGLRSAIADPARADDQPAPVAK